MAGLRVLNQIARWAQILVGLAVLVTGVMTAVAGFQDFYTFETVGWQGWTASVGAFCGLQVALIGCVGLYALKRPHHVHWHLTMALDVVAIIASLGAIVLLAILLPVWGSCDYDVGLCDAGIAAIVFSILILCASIVPAASVCYMRPRGKLIVPVSAKTDDQHDWFHMEELAAPAAPEVKYTAVSPPPLAAAMEIDLEEGNAKDL